MTSFTRREVLGKAQRAPESTDISFSRDKAESIARISAPMQGSSAFELVIVEEVISNPYDYFNRPWPIEEDKIAGRPPLTLGDVLSERVKEVDPVTPGSPSKKLNNPWQLENPVMVDFAPPNSIKGFRKSSQSSGGASKSIICFPFFSSHLSLPVKPGETVWVMKFNDETYYWMCRQASYRQIEDVNYTFSPREQNVRKNLRDTKDQSIFAGFNSEVSSTGNVDYEEVVKKSIAYKEEFTGEPVPRLSKDCSDFLIQGSNNSHIYLGKEKFEDPSSVAISPETFTNSQVESETDPLLNRKPLSPAIDLCVLRKANELFDLKSAAESHELTNENLTVEVEGLSAIAGFRKNNKFRYYENEKARDLLGKSNFENELLDNDVLNCIARIYMSNSKTIDDLLGLEDFAGEATASPSGALREGDYGAMVAFGTNARVAGRETVKIGNLLGDSGIYFSPAGDIIIFANRVGGAKIVLQATGDIKIVPGPAGVIKLGSDEPQGGIAATETATSTLGSVEGTPIFTTAGGIIGIKGGFGTFGKKVLIDI